MATDGGNNIDNRGPVTLAVTVAMLACSTIFVTLRVISRTTIVRRFSLDDWFIVVAWLIALGLSVAICQGTSVGLGRHEVDVLDAWRPTLKRTEYAFAVLYNPALMATKTSILVFYLTLSKTQKIFRWATLLTLAAVNVGGLALTLLNILQCNPISAAFHDPVPPTARCTDILTLYLSSAPLNIITDFAILVLPMPILTGMRLPRKQKIILVVTFSFGVFVAIVDVVRIAYLQSAATSRLQNIQEHKDGNTRNAESTDFSWYASFTFLWSAVEVQVGMMCACVPALKPLASRFMPHILRDHSDDRTKGFNSSDAAASVDLVNAQRLQSIPEHSPVSPTYPPASPLSPPPAARSPLTGNEPMGMMDFLTTPESQGEPCERTSTAMTNSTRHTRQPTPTFFDFVNIKRRKSMVQMTNQESFFPFAMVTFLFFLWGFAYGLLDVLNARFQQAAGMSTGQSIGIHSAYFGAYLVAPLTFGRLVLKNWGFKACYIVGLIIYACGTLVFWPSAVLSSFPAFLVSNFIVGLGLSTLEIAANPFIALCGPPQYAEIRLNLSQGIQAIGTVASPLLAQKVLFKVDASSLIDVQWTYLGISLFTVLLALGYYYVPLPEATDEELADASERIDSANTADFNISIPKTKNYCISVIYVTLGLGVLSQFCYVGGQEVVSTSFTAYLAEVYPGLSEVNHQAIGHTAFAVSRFFCAFLNLFLLPRHTLLFFYATAIAFSALAMNWSGTVPASMIVMIYFFEGPIFSLIYAMCLRGMGRHTKDASTLLTAAISGGAVFAPIAFGARNARGAQYSFCVVVAAFATGAVFALYLELFSKAKRVIDPIDDPSLPQDEPSSNEARSRQSSTLGETWYTSIKSKMNEKLPTREHRERKSWASSQQSNEKS